MQLLNRLKKENTVKCFLVLALTLGTSLNLTRGSQLITDTPLCDKIQRNLFGNISKHSPSSLKKQWQTLSPKRNKGI